MVSEDSDQIVSGLFSVHRLRYLCDVRETLSGLVYTTVDQCDAASELLKVSLLRRMQRVSREERNDRVDQVAPPTHREPIQMLLVVVVSPIGDHSTHSEETLQLSQTPDALRALRHRELMRHLIAGLVALAACSRWLPNKPNGEATLSNLQNR